MFKKRVNMPCKQAVENAPMQETARRLYEAARILSRGMATKPSEVAAFFGVTQQRLNNWESRGISQQGMISICESHPAIQLTWLSRGDGPAPVHPSTTHPATPAAPPGVEHVTTSSEGVPLISWVQAGCWADVADPYAVGDAEDWLPCPVRHGSRTYCLRVRGDSMHNPEGRPSYSDGDIIFVDPDRDARHGDRVVVRLDDQAEATFKQLLIEDGRKLLKALNPGWVPRYIEINGNATMAGVVIGKWVPE